MKDLSTVYDSRFYDSQADGSLTSAKVVVPLIINLFNPKSVIDVGCGVGTWIRVMADLGVSRVLGVDGGHVDIKQALVSGDEFIAWDLSKPLPPLGRFDLALSLEVAEHLPKSCAKTFVKDLTSLAPVVVFSAALPGQGGTNHINEQWPEYWETLFLGEGFVKTDPLRPRLWYDYRVDSWYRQNLYVFLEHSFMEADAQLSALPRGCSSDDLTLVSRRLLQRYATTEADLGLRAVLRLIPKLVVRSFKRRLPGRRTGGRADAC